MIITQTPYRISFFGGGTDYPAWYRNHGGAVLATTIDKYCYISCRTLPPFFEHRIRVVWSKSELCKTVDDITHPSVRETLKFLNVTQGVEIHHDGDLPAWSGMGSSSAFTVGLLAALQGLRGRLTTASQLAADAIHIEQQLLQETVGSQDQVLAAHGGFCHVHFARSGSISVRPLILPAERLQELQSSLMLFYTGIKRTATDVAQSFVPSIDQRRRQLRLIAGMVNEAIEILAGSGPIADFGALLHEYWQTKRSLSSTVSSTEIDAMYCAAVEAGAVGGKITGAGGGGFMLLFVPQRSRAAVRECLANHIHVPFGFEPNGSRVIFYRPGIDYSDAVADNHSRDIPPAKESLL